MAPKDVFNQLVKAATISVSSLNEKSLITSSLTKERRRRIYLATCTTNMKPGYFQYISHRWPSRQRDRITLVLRALHWLPVCHRIQFKVLVNVFKCMYGLSPDYLTELVRVCRRDNRLRQPDTVTLSEQVTIRVIGKRPFGISAPPLWNRLPITVRAAKYILTFKRTLKTHLFQLYYK